MRISGGKGHSYWVLSASTQLWLRHRHPFPPSSPQASAGAAWKSGENLPPRRLSTELLSCSGRLFMALHRGGVCPLAWFQSQAGMSQGWQAPTRRANQAGHPLRHMLKLSIMPPPRGFCWKREAGGPQLHGQGEEDPWREF